MSYLDNQLVGYSLQIVVDLVTVGYTVYKARYWNLLNSQITVIIIFVMSVTISDVGTGGGTGGYCPLQ